MNYLNFNSLLAKIVFLLVAIWVSQYNILFSVLVFLIYLYLDQSSIESMTNTSSIENELLSETSKVSTDQNANFIKNNCKNGNLMSSNNIVTPSEVSKSFPNIKFTNDECNPCDTDCNFEIITTEERVTTEENLKSMDSNSLPVNRDDAIKKK